VLAVASGTDGKRDEILEQLLMGLEPEKLAWVIDGYNATNSK
jgi:hypothetical protein